MSGNATDEAKAAADFDWDTMEADDIDGEHDESGDEVIDDEAMDDVELEGQDQVDVEQDEEEKVGNFLRVALYECI